jgi:hypothetical protein
MLSQPRFDLVTAVRLGRLPVHPEEHATWFLAATVNREQYLGVRLFRSRGADDIERRLHRLRHVASDALDIVEGQLDPCFPTGRSH